MSTRQPLEQSIVHSALWAAAGDALGWMTEISGGPDEVLHRTGVATVSEPVPWHQFLGGPGGPVVELPAGSYSDDTQLRLAVSRAITGDGAFDVEAFAKIEITVWPTYELGGGRGTRTAAANLSRRDVTWFSNFFGDGTQGYVQGGGNGAAMRVQPHVWAARPDSRDLIRDVLRDALVTHGHPHGFCGAVFHALALSATIATGQVPTLEASAGFAESFRDLSEVVSTDPPLAAAWQPAWEESAGMSLRDALDTARAACLRDIRKLVSIRKGRPSGVYRRALDVLGCRTAQYRGSGLKTALAASALADAFRGGEPEEALACAANELGSDTDTIATMAGALLGAAAPRPPPWRLQDRAYIVAEAQRLAAIAQGHARDSFPYPDLAGWTPPASQDAAIRQTDDGMAMAGLGRLTPTGPGHRAGNLLWQSFRLPFGQTVLAKRPAAS